MIKSAVYGLKGTTAQIEGEEFTVTITSVLCHLTEGDNDESEDEDYSVTARAEITFTFTPLA